MPTEQASVSVSVPDFGTVIGGTTEAAELFLGMPYAEPPIGKLRFMPAVAVGQLKGTLNATQFCPSVVGAGFMRQTKQTTLPNDASIYTDEDALCVNVWRPKGTTASSTLPIMVFIYGGGFVSGSSTNAWYDGKNLAQYQDRVVVTLNYRVGPLGFWANEGLASETSGTGSANGLLDQVLALKWVNKYGAAFGGDVNNIGLFGESAGALSVCSHLVSPKSAGLFKRAILESGACNGPWGVGGKQEGLHISNKLMMQMKCSDVACMQALPSSSLASWPYSFETIHSLETPWKLTPYDWEFPGYWIDDFFLPAEQYSLFANGIVNAEAVMIIATSMDGFLSFLYPDADYPTSCDGMHSYNSTQKYVEYQHILERSQ
jgi:carboxylesterase type B